MKVSIEEAARNRRWKYVGVYGTSWKLPRNMFVEEAAMMEAMEASTSIDSGNFHVLQWKLPLTSMELNLLSPTSMEISMEATIILTTSMEVSMEVN